MTPIVDEDIKEARKAFMEDSSYLIKMVEAAAAQKNRKKK